MRYLSWIGTSLFFLDAILTIIISSISAADVTMLLFPEWASYRILLAEFFAFFIMSVLVAVGPKRAVPLFLLGGGAFTLFTILSLTIVGTSAVSNPEWAFLTEGIVHRLEEADVVEHVVRAQQEAPAMFSVVFFQLFFRSMSSAMLGFSGYEVIPASGKHAARPKWKVINTALTLAAVFLIGTGVIQLLAAQKWKIPSTEGYSTLLIEYEIAATQIFGNGVDDTDIIITEEDRILAEEIYHERLAKANEAEITTDGEQEIEKIATDLVTTRQIEAALGETTGEWLLTVAALLLAIILLLAQGGGYVGGAAVAANASRLGRLPAFFSDDRNGIAVIWGFAAIAIPIIREVVVVEAYYAFGFVTAFAVTGTTVFFVRDDVLIDRGIEPGSAEAKSLRFAGLRGMIASYVMLIVLITQKTDALIVIVSVGVILTAYMVFIAYGGFKRVEKDLGIMVAIRAGKRPQPQNGIERAWDETTQRGIADLVNHMIETGLTVKFNVEPQRIRRLISFAYGVQPQFWHHENGHGERTPEPNLELETAYQAAFSRVDELLECIEHYSHYGIFTFIEKYYHNWIGENRDAATVQLAMLERLFPNTPLEEMWEEFSNYHWTQQPEEVWQFSRQRYQWAKDQWPNLSDRITTIWTLQDFGLLPLHDEDGNLIGSTPVNNNPIDKKDSQ